MYCFLLVLHTLCLLNLVFQDLLMKLLNGMTMFISITDILQILLKVSRSLSTIQRKYHFLQYIMFIFIMRIALLALGYQL